MKASERTNRIYAALLWAYRERFSGLVSDWVEGQNVKFSEPGKHGNFSFYGRNYLREPLDFYGITALTHMVLCFGTQTGKTTTMFAGAIFRMVDMARRVLFVHPASEGPAGAHSIAKTRFIPTLRASPATSGLIPSGAARFDLTRSQQILTNGSIGDWVGSNSVGQLASNPIGDVYQDEIDKFNVTRRRDTSGKEVEADACELADERATTFEYPKLVKASTPTLSGGRIWTRLLETDLRRRFVPCPLCGRHHPSSHPCLIVWREQFTVLPKVWGFGTSYEANSPLPLAFVKWDDEAKRPDGTWDLERVEKSAGYLCPHCGGRFRDEDKTWMDANGTWIATKSGALRTVGYHLPSWYAYNTQTSAGNLALQFLKGVKSIEGPRNFINSKCAEPFMHQGVSVNRVGIAGRQIEITGEWLKIISVDYHQREPYFWAVVRAWNGSDKSHGLTYRSFNEWSELDELQDEFKVIPEAVIIDEGFNQSEVHHNCADLQKPTRCRLGDEIQGQAPECIGWTPSKAHGTKRLYRDEETGLYAPLQLRKNVDPFAGTDLAHRVRIEVIDFRNDIFEDILENIRAGKTGLTWTIAEEMDTDEYHRHMAGTVRETSPDGRSYKWRGRGGDFPDHIRACERLNLVAAYRLKLISFEAIHTKEKELQPT